MGKPSTDVIRRVFDESGSYFIDIRPWAGGLEMRTVEGEQSAGYYGSLNLALSPDFAEELGKALIAAARDIRLAKVAS